MLHRKFLHSPPPLERDKEEGERWVPPAGLEEEKAGILVTGAARQQGLRTGQTVGSHRVCPTVHITALGVSEMTTSPSDLVGFHPEA